jgi:hypothetical protein
VDKYKIVESELRGDFLELPAALKLDVFRMLPEADVRLGNYGVRVALEPGEARMLRTLSFGGTVATGRAILFVLAHLRGELEMEQLERELRALAGKGPGDAPHG